jgi:hypothetical protein
VECLLDLSCNEIQSRALCEWAQSPSGQVCP